MGFLAGFIGAIPPGPLNVTCLKKSLQGERRDAYRVALGGATVDTFICALIGLGLGWILEKVVTNAWVRGTLALFLVAYGVKILFVDARRDAERAETRTPLVPLAPVPFAAPCKRPVRNGSRKRLGRAAKGTGARGTSGVRVSARSASRRASTKRIF